MLDKLEAIKERYIYLEEQLADPSVISDLNRYKKVNKEYKDLKEVVDENIEDRQQEAVKGERIVDEAVINFRQWHAGLEVVPAAHAAP